MKHRAPSGDEMLTILEALANPLRLRIIALLADRRIHVSQLAREVSISRPLLYMHLKRLGNAGLVTSQIELSEDGKAMNYYEVIPFAFDLSSEIIAEAVKTLTIAKTASASLEDGNEKGDI
jgi:DNA-binding transcriptional ArsR family regulator